MSRRLEELDGLRGIAAISVVFYHYFYNYDRIYIHQNITPKYFLIGKFGVELFFMISGFVIFWSLNNTQKPLDFIISRFSRLYPVYWVSVTLTFLFVSFFGLPGKEVSFTSFLGNFLMFHNYFGIPNVDGVYWTLKVELTFYLWMLILFSIKMLKKIDVFIFFALIICTLVNLKIIFLPELIVELIFLTPMPFFCIGICYYKILNQSKNQLTIINLFLSLLTTLFISSLFKFFVFLFLSFILYLAVNNRLHILKNRILLFLGTISYPLYLIHQNIGYIIIKKGYQYGIHPYISITFSIFFTIIISFLLNKFIEKPSGKYLKKTYKQKNPIIVKQLQD